MGHWYLNNDCSNVCTTPIREMGCRQCLPLSVVQLKGKHCRKPHCRNGVVDTFGHYGHSILRSVLKNPQPNNLVYLIEVCKFFVSSLKYNLEYNFLKFPKGNILNYPSSLKLVTLSATEIGKALRILLALCGFVV